jgi:uncharacterized protein (DUF305 family)
MRSRFVIGAAAFLLAVPVAVAQDANQMAGHGMAGQAMMDANQTMMTAMQGMQPSGDPDRDFAMMMIPHHQGAIDMAKVELEHGMDPELKAMAEKIIADQEREIAELKNWLSKHGQ